MTCSTAVPGMAWVSVSYALSKTMTARAPESPSWWRSSEAV